MIIGIDGNEANVTRKVGVSVYTLNLLKRFAGKSSPGRQFIVYLRQPPNDDMPLPSDYFRYRIIPGKFLWSRLFLPLNLFLQRGIDVFFSPAHYSPGFCPVPLAVTIHDLSYLYYPGEFLKKDLVKLESWTAESIRRAAAIIAVSKTTKKDILKNYRAPDEKVSVVYNGYDKQSTPEKLDEVWKRIAGNYGLAAKKFLLYVGTLQPRKNVAMLIRTFASFRKKHPEYKLVLVGKKGWLYDEIIAEAEKPEMENSVVHTGYLPDDEVIALYRHAFCLVLPSLYEGFGLPVLEAMANSCPAAASFSSSLPEVGGDACLYFDPQNPADLEEKLTMLVKDTGLRRDLVAKGLKRTKSFSWDTCADQTLEIIESVFFRHPELVSGSR